MVTIKQCLLTAAFFVLVVGMVYASVPLDGFARLAVAVVVALGAAFVPVLGLAKFKARSPR